MTHISPKIMSLGLLVIPPLTLLTACLTPLGSLSDPSQLQRSDDKWNSTDARAVCGELMRSALSKRWIADFSRNHAGQQPSILVQDFEDRTSEKVNTKFIFEAVRQELINSGKVRFIDGDQRQKMLKEFNSQRTKAIQKKVQNGSDNPQFADYLLVGSISRIAFQADRVKTITYQIEMRLTHLETSEIVWTEAKNIRKYSGKSKVTL